METNNITDTNLSGVAHVDTAGESSAVGGQNPQEPTFTLSELKSVLGKDFKDKDTALKSVKDTFNYVGRVGQLEEELKKSQKQPTSAANATEVEGIKTELQKMKDELWFADNSAYKPHRQLVETFAKAKGKNFSEIVDSQEFKDVFTKVQGFEKIQNTRTVLESNPRLASSQDKLSKAQNLAATRSRKALSEAGEIAVSAVLDAYPDLEK